MRRSVSFSGNDASRFLMLLCYPTFEYKSGKNRRNPLHEYLKQDEETKIYQTETIKYFLFEPLPFRGKKRGAPTIRK